ncbi:hypothetical protein P168DRAFT_236422 [Aspergillus campestris IBT 28561]|uniref:DUF6536 domain-containing protein n=1 Tax=Aspergillus campestris (strain IBT 28561) TaxID=1392248 RepID=A0A2I1D2H6_ASPC2|nr:uncharacterized protein P168DRAFT_236422 [Aspergillus campestris IBT 28561]PKY04081.1 hypothetical protein P168DRAFT_236422 [Aspergillus campestris IBT 28561]
MSNGQRQRDASDSEEKNNLVSYVKSWRLYPLKRPSTSTVEDFSTGTDHSRKWIKGVVLCSWVIAAVLVANIILTVAAVVVAYSKNNEKRFSVASLYMGNCSVAKNSTTGVHLVINILSTAMLGASNYCLQCLASPSRSEVDEAHGQKTWLQIGVPNIVSLLRNQRGRRWYLGAVLLTTSLPIHLIYNSAVFFSVGPAEYTVVVAQDKLIRYHDNSTIFEQCFAANVGIEPLQFNAALENESFKILSKEDCIETFAQDYASGQRALVLVTNASMPDSEPIAWVGKGNYRSFDVKSDSVFGWLCGDDYRCSKSQAEGLIEDWSVQARRWSTPSLHDHLRPDKMPRTYPIDHCMSLPAQETCQLFFSPLICIIVIGCNIVKLICTLLTARDSREELFLTVGDAISSFLTHPDPTTERACLLSKASVEKGTLGWHKYTRKPRKSRQSDAKEPQLPVCLPPRQRWFQAASISRWLCTLAIFVAILVPAGIVLRLGIIDFTKSYGGNSIWSSGLGEVTTATILSSMDIPATASGIFSMVFMANIPQLLVSAVYFQYNALLTCMLSAVEYDNYATNRKPLRVSWPRPDQRSTYYLSLPFRYSLPLLLVSAILHWLVSQSLFFVQIVPFDRSGVPQQSEQVVTCGYSPLAIICAMILGVALLLGVGLLGLRRFKSRMPLAGQCSAAISAACHPTSSTDEHALKPVQWGEVEMPRAFPWHNELGDSPLYGGESDELGRPTETGFFHCAFSSGEVSEPSAERLYA